LELTCENNNYILLAKSFYVKWDLLITHKMAFKPFLIVSRYNAHFNPQLNI